MVGVLRNRKQLDYNIGFGFYHIPQEWVSERRLPIEYVAIYQSPSLFERESAGIFKYGRVIKTELLARGEIDNIPTAEDPRKQYYKFYVDSWLDLEAPIRISRKSPDVNLFTGKDEFFNSEKVEELYITNSDVRELYNKCKKKYQGIRVCSTGGIVRGFAFEGFCIFWTDRHIMLIHRGRRLLKIKKTLAEAGGIDELLEKINLKINYAKNNKKTS